MIYVVRALVKVEVIPGLIMRVRPHLEYSLKSIKIFEIS